VSVHIEPATYLAGHWSVCEPARALEVAAEPNLDSEHSDLAIFISPNGRRTRCG
jgi:hypothetical protein